MEEQDNQEQVVQTQTEKKGQSKMVFGVIVIVVVLLAMGGGYLLTRGNLTTETVMDTNEEIQKQQNPTEMVEDASMETSEVMEEEDVDGAMMEDEAREIVVEGSGFEFSPSEISVSAGEKVRIVFKNTGGTHDFRIEELDLGTEVIQEGNEESFEFTVPEEFESLTYFCSVANHRALGMEGVITVN